MKRKKRNIPKIKLFTLLFVIIFSNVAAGQKYFIHNSKAITLSSNFKIDNKPEWLTEAFDELNSFKYPRLKAISYWNEEWENNYGPTTNLRIDSSPESLEAYIEGVKEGNYVSTPNFKITTAQNQYSYKLIPPNDSIERYISAFPDFGGTEDQVSADRISAFINISGHNLTWAYFSDQWADGIEFPAEAVSIIHNYGEGIIPYIRMMPWSDVGAENQKEFTYTMQKIIDGKFDTELREWAIAANNTGFPLLLEFGVEVNGDWFPWNGIYNGAGTTDEYGDPNYPDGPERFKDAYIHIIQIFRNLNVNNITWFFHINSEGSPDEWWNSPEYYYPGDEYIDWIGVSVYGPQSWREDWSSFGEKMEDAYSIMENISDSKPFALLEFGADENGGKSLEVYMLYFVLPIAMLILVVIILLKIKKSKNNSRID